MRQNLIPLYQALTKFLMSTFKSSLRFQTLPVPIHAKAAAAAAPTSQAHAPL